MKTHSNYYASQRTYAGHHDNVENEHGLGFYEVTMQGKCAGTFVNNKVHGRAAKTWIQGETYVGQYTNNIKEGHGVHTWASGAYFVGQFENNMPYGYGVLTTVHDGAKFIGRVVNYWPIEGKWYTSDNIEMEDPRDVGIYHDGCVYPSPGVKINAVGETEIREDNVITTTEKNFVTTMQDHYNGKRVSYHWGDWIKWYEGGFRYGRYHGNGHLEYHNGWKHTGVFAFGHEIYHPTYTSVATSNPETRSTQRRLNRNYCMVYDMMIAHCHQFVTRPLVIVEFGIGRGDHLLHLRRLFPDATIIGVDNLSPDSEPVNELEAQQIMDLAVAAKIPGVEFYFGTDCYDKQSIYNIVSTHGDFDFAIHDATHTTDAWSKLDTIREVLSGPHGILFTEEIGCSALPDDESSMDPQQIELALAAGWRIWDLRDVSDVRQCNSLIGVYMNNRFDGGELNMLEVSSASN